MRYIEVEKNVKIALLDLNSDQEKTVLFIHGWPVNHKMFEYQLNVLPMYGYRCIAMDLRGFGESDAPWTGYSYDRMADDIHEVIRQLNLKNITLVGFSMGGGIVIRYMARHHGHGVSKLALVSAAAPSFVQRPGFPYGATVEDVNKLIAQAYTDRPQMVTDFSADFFAMHHSEAFRAWFHGLGVSSSSYGTIKTAESLRDTDLRGDLAKINVPTGIFHGILDRKCPFEFAIMMHQGIKDSTLYPFYYSGHGVFYDELELFNCTFIQFLNQQED